MMETIRTASSKRLDPGTTMSWTPRFTIAGLMIVTAVVAVVVTVIMNSGRRRVIECLDTPVEVSSWSGASLTLSDGRTVPLPDVRGLPVKSEILKAATRRGVEVADDGRIYCLVRVWHWCGNDPVAEQIARVDLSHLLIYVEEVESTLPEKPDFSARPDACEGLCRDAWDPSDYGQFQVWRSLITEDRAILHAMARGTKTEAGGQP